jgi:hypothetical protein
MVTLFSSPEEEKKFVQMNLSFQVGKLQNFLQFYYGFIGKIFVRSSVNFH